MSRMRTERLSTLTDAGKREWHGEFDLPIHLSYDALSVVEETRINGVTPVYLRYRSDRDLGRSNLYLVETDFSSMDSSLKGALPTIKRWYPDFLRLKTLECGSFTGIAEGTCVRNPDDYREVLPALAAEMDAIARESGAEIQLIRDVPYEKYRLYREALAPFGFYPAPGFPDTEISVRWSGMEQYLTDLRKSIRIPLRKYLRNLRDEHGVEYEFVSEYSPLTPRFAELWKNVYGSAHDYQREYLDERYFAGVAKHMRGSSEALVFRKDGRIIAFMLSLLGDDTYYGLNFGADYAVPGYSKMNLYRLGILLRIERIAKLGKTKFNLGITNYDVKLEMGASVLPLVYFIRHTESRRYSRALAKLLYDNIKHPDTRVHRPFKDYDPNPIEYPKYLLEVKTGQYDRPDDDIFLKISKYHRTDTVRLSRVYNFYPEFTSAQESSITMQGRERIVLLGTNSYLGAATFPEVKEAAIKAIEKYGTGCSGSPLLNGTLDLHNRLEEELARFLDREAVLLCSTGYQTNLAGIYALAEPGDALVMDERSHRSLFDAGRISGADCYVYRHTDVSHLEHILRKLDGRRKLIISDSVFSMEGVLADLKSICSLAKKYRARVFIDEAHGVGVFGEHGRGVCEEAGVEQDVDLVMGTFSKSFASIGGFIAGKKEVIEFIKHTGSPHIFSASLPPASIATVLAVLELLRTRPELKRKPLENAKFMADGLQALGYNAAFRGTQIVPVVFGNDTLAMAAYKRFMESGVYVNPVVPPAVPAAAAGFRTSYIATHRHEDLEFALSVFEKHSHDFTDTRLSNAR